jgi:hypothetical protein
MSSGLLGADSASPVTTQLQGQTLIELATSQFDAPPAFWGRYFTSPSTPGTVEYRGAVENAPLNAASIPVLPIARQTTRVGGSLEDGAADAQANVDDLLETFGAAYLASQGGTFLLFLDVEGAPQDGSPSLSLDYCTGWAQTVSGYSSAASAGQVTIQPCIYARSLDTDTWQVLAQAIQNGIECGGAWVARYLDDGCEEVPDWDDSFVNPTGAIPCQILAWQYAGDCFGDDGFDCSHTNPGIDPEAGFLDFLILPPPPEGD